MINGEIKWDKLYDLYGFSHHFRSLSLKSISLYSQFISIPKGSKSNSEACNMFWTYDQVGMNCACGIWNDFVRHAIQVAARGLRPPWLGKAPAEACRASEILGSIPTCSHGCQLLQMKIYMCIWLRPRSLQLEMTHALQYTAYLLTRQDDAGTGPSICRQLWWDKSRQSLSSASSPTTEVH